MTPLAEILRDRIRHGGPIPFRDFMDAALYHREHGYYRRHRDPFGKDGDFYTAEQVQPVFGILIAARIRALYREMGEPADFQVVELGAGRGEMAAALAEFRYTGVDVDRGAVPESLCGVVFSNEYFDALPVDRVIWEDGAARESLVGYEADRFVWVAGDKPGAEIDNYLQRYFPPPHDFESVEAPLEALRSMDCIAQRLARGFVFTIDYGYTARESRRFPQGTLMSYRRHQAVEDVLTDPGERDITTHVPFTALEDRGTAQGLQTVRFESLARTLLDAGDADQFAAALGTDDSRRRLQLKTLLFGMGESFRTLLQRK